MTQRGRLVVISGPSGAGKTTVCRALRRDPRVQFSVSATTRRKRDGEVDGVDYRFLTQAGFDAALARDEFLESATYNGNRYGTLRAPMEEALAAGRVFVLEIEVQGTRQLRARGVDGIYVFVVPPSLAELERRIRARGQNTEEEIADRLRIAEEELRAKDLYDHVIENDDLDRALAEVRRVIGL
ncbi:MAG: guanylate kinase [Planctomycetes bacterium]|nr:guanylate kinase [Planctomycetota bacterium]